MKRSREGALNVAPPTTADQTWRRAVWQVLFAMLMFMPVTSTFAEETCRNVSGDYECTSPIEGPWWCWAVSFNWSSAPQCNSGPSPGYGRCGTTDEAWAA